jgi:DedD protein
MAFFKSRSSGNASADDKNADVAAQSLDTLRRQARHRLIGATVLVLLAVIGFPLVFDTKPRELAADIRIEMPDKDAVRPSQAPTPPPSVVPAPAPVPDAEIPVEQKAAEVVTKAVVPPSVMPEKPQQAAAKEEEVPSKPDPGSEKSGDSAPRFIVQVGAFAEEASPRKFAPNLKKRVSKPIPILLKPKRANAYVCVLALLQPKKKRKKRSTKSSLCSSVPRC